MVASPLQHRLSRIHGFVLDEKAYTQGWATAQTPNGSAVSGVWIKTLTASTRVGLFVIFLARLETAASFLTR